MRSWTLLFLFSVLLLNNISNAQSYFPFPDSNAVWNCHAQIGCSSGPPYLYDEYYSYVFSNDTFINNNAYHKVITPFVAIYNACYLPWTSAGYKGCVRQDTSNRKVYFVPPNDSIEYALYDFNLQVGDTLSGWLSQYCPLPQIVTLRDSILIGNTYRRRWLAGFSIIEGIGSAFDPFELCFLPVSGPVRTLTCFEQDGKKLYPDTNSSCQTITNILLHNPENPAFKLLPNPVDNVLSIVSDLRIISVRIISSESKLIIYKESNKNSSLDIDVSFLNSGIYFLSVETEDGQIIFKKFIKN